MTEVYNIYENKFSYQDFSISHATLHDEWAGSFRIENSKLIIEYDNFKVSNDCSEKIREKYKDYHKCTVTYDILDIDQLYLFSNYADFQSYTGDNGNYSGQVIRLTEAIDKLNTEESQFLYAYICGCGLMLKFTEFDLHIDIKNVVFNWE